MSICCVIPMYGKEEYTKKCIDLTIQNAGVEMEIAVVDDGSPEEFYDDRVHIIRLDKNSGFTRAANEGILWAQKQNFDYALLLNNDTEPEPNFAKYLLDAMDDETVGIVSSVRVHNGRDRKYELCGSDLIRGYQYFVDDKDILNAPDLMSVNWAPLCSGLLRMDMVREIGLLYNRFRNHCSDSHYCIYAKIMGWKVLLSTKSRVLHHLSVTTTANNVQVDDDQKKFLEILAGMDYAKVMAQMPLDGEAKTWGKISFEVFKK